MPKSVLLFATRKKAAAKEARQKLTEWLSKKKLDVLDVTDTRERLSEADLKNVTLGVAIGGDGTFLTLVRRLAKKDQIPLMGVNLGTVGFITEIHRDDMFAAIEQALAKKYREERRPLLQVDVWRGKEIVESCHVFNDAAVTKDARTTMLKFEVRVGEELLSYIRADGYIVATPTGSTAYALSAGGPLVHPEVNGLVVIPICSHALSTRPSVVPQGKQVEIRMEEFTGEVYMVCDGQVNVEIKPGDRILVRTSETYLRLYRPPDQAWSETIRTKLKML